ncbi:type IV pilin protein [Dongshaea marina]|uniref:type IV pilin protein n=1 Tax=Dongshaea marina TaxID=2047966 RepID=UPI000D3ED9D8|nr:type IV pilin protein [Dongshaea marina]
MRLNFKGLSLIELLIAVSIVSLLAAVAYPAYIGHMRASHRAQAKEHLFQLQLKQEAWRLSNNSYTASVADLGAASDAHYTYRVTNASLSTYTLNAIAIAEGIQSDDEGCTSLQLDQSDNREPAHCW